MSQDSSTSRSFPPPDQPYLAELVNTPPQPNRTNTWIAAILIGSFAVVGLVLFATWFVPKEMLQWRIARAENQRLDGDLKGAIGILDEDIAKNPSDPDLRLRRAQWLMENKEYQRALDDVNVVIEADPENADAYVLRAQIYPYQRKFQEAVDDWKHVINLDRVASGPYRPKALNGLAYARSLANIEIDEGLVNIDEAMRIVPEDFAMLDTRGFLYYRKGDLDRAIQDLNYAVEFAESYHHGLTNGGFTGTDPRMKQLAEHQIAQSVAVIRYHRALVLDARNEKEKAEEDRRRVRELGFEPDETLF